MRGGGWVGHTFGIGEAKLPWGTYLEGSRVVVRKSDLGRGGGQIIQNG